MANGFLGGFFKPFSAAEHPAAAPDQYGYVNPMAGLNPIDRYKYLNQQQPATLMALASGLMQGDLAGGFANAGQEMQQYRAWDEKKQDILAKKQEDLQAQNATYQWLISKGLTEQDARAAMLNPAILSEMLKGEIYPSPDQSGEERFFGTPVPYRKPDGTLGYLLYGTKGSTKEVPAPEGAQFMSPFDKNYGAQLGKEQAKIAATLPMQELYVGEAMQNIDDLINDPALPAMVGPVGGLVGVLTGGYLSRAQLPNLSPDARRVGGRIEQLQGTAFMQARQMLRGGGPITDFEGKKAEAAYARLMDTGLSYQDYRQALEDFRDAVKAGLEKLRAYTATEPGQAVPQPGGGGGGGVPTYNPATGQIE